MQEVVAGALAGLANIISDVRKSPSQSTQYSMSSPEPPFSIVPCLPRGQILKFEILSTWGDVHYVGFNGMDIFDENGMQILPAGKSYSNAKLPKKLAACRSESNFIHEISAEPANINVLPEYVDDPRVVDNLVDGVSFTRDDLHVWLAPLMRRTEENCAIATITLAFQSPLTLSMIRVWNYNKSRTHCSRGVRLCRMYLDETKIFEGEIKCSQGDLSSADASSEVILFTTNEAALKQIAKHDEAMGYFAEDSTKKWVQKLKDKLSIPRPSTAERHSMPPSSPKELRPSTQAFSNNTLSSNNCTEGTQTTAVSVSLSPNSIQPKVYLVMEMRSSCASLRSSDETFQMLNKKTPNVSCCHLHARRRKKVPRVSHHTIL